MANLGKKFDPEVLSTQEVARILKSFPPSITGVRNRALIAVYLYAQLRCNEALDLRPSDIDWNRGAVTVLRGKGGKRRIAAIPREILHTYVTPWIEVRPDSAYLFSTHKGGRIGDTYVRKMLKRQAGRAGIDHRVHVHGLRHTGAFQLAEAGASVRDIQKQLGHTSLEVTARYIDHLGADDRVERIGSLEW